MRTTVGCLSITLGLVVACGGSDDNGTSSGGAGGGGATGGSAGSTGGSAGSTGGSAGAVGGSGGAVGGSGGAVGGSGGAMGGSGGAMGGAAGAGGDTSAPWIMSLSPIDGATGVAVDTNIVITFSEPMSPTTVLAAYQSTVLPASAVTFTWNADGSVLTINPNASLPYGEGTSLSAAPYTVDYTFTTAAQDLAGNGLAQNMSFSFETLRRITQTFQPSRSLTGHVRDDGNVTGLCFVGDDNFANELRGFISYDLSAIPTANMTMESATLSLVEKQRLNSPYSLGALHLRTLSYSALDASAFNAPVNFDMTVPATGTTKTLDLTSWVDGYVRIDPLVQYRLNFSLPTNSDSNYDAVEFDGTSPLTVVYIVP